MNRGVAINSIIRDPINVLFLLIYETQRDPAANPALLPPCSVRAADCTAPAFQSGFAVTLSLRGAFVKEARLLSEWPGSLSVGLLSAHAQAGDV